MNVFQSIVSFLLFPSGLFVLLAGMAYEWADRKVVARFQNRIGPRWFQPLADVVKLMSKEEIVPEGVDRLHSVTFDARRTRIQNWGSTSICGVGRTISLCSQPWKSTASRIMHAKLTEQDHSQ